MLAVMLAATIVPLCISESSDGAGESQANPIVFWNKTIILVPEILAGTVTDENTQTLEPPTALAIDWGDGNYQLETVSGYVHAGDVEYRHDYATTGTYHIQCTPQCNDPNIRFDSYELWVEIMGAPTVYFYDGETEITSIVAENGYGVGTYANDYFTSVSAPVEEPTKTGKVFIGWFVGDDEFDFDTIIRQPTILQAHWADEGEMIQHNITYYDGTNVIGNQKVFDHTDGSISMTITQANPVKDGYTFKGWSTTANGTVQYQKGATVSVGTAGVNLYAVWEQNEVAPTTVTVYIDGHASTFNVGTKVSDIPDPVYGGYKFVGWYSDANKTNEVAPTTVLTNGMQLFTKWVEVVPEPVDEPEVETQIVEKVTVTTETKVSELKAPEKEGYEVEGWYSDEACTQKLGDDSVLVNGMSAYAKYKAAEKNEQFPVSVIAIAVTAIGAVIAVVGFRYHPIIVIIGIAVAAVGGLDIAGIIDLGGLKL